MERKLTSQKMLEMSTEAFTNLPSMYLTLMDSFIVMQNPEFVRFFYERIMELGELGGLYLKYLKTDDPLLFSQVVFDALLDTVLADLPAVEV